MSEQSVTSESITEINSNMWVTNMKDKFLLLISKTREWMRENNLGNSSIGLCVVFMVMCEIIPLRYLFSLSTVLLLIFSVRQCMSAVVSGSVDNIPLLNLIQLWIINTTFSFCDSFVGYITSMFMFGCVLKIVFNIAMLALLSKVVNSVASFYATYDKIPLVNTKDLTFDYSELYKDKNVFSTIVLSINGFISRLYSRNSGIMDEVGLKILPRIGTYVFEYVDQALGFVKTQSSNAYTVTKSKFFKSA